MPKSSDFPNLIGTLVVGFALNGQQSGSVQLDGQGLIGFMNMGTWTAAPLSFEHSLNPPHDGGTWTGVYEISGAATVAAAAMAQGTATVLLPTTSVLRSGVPGWVRLRSGLLTDGTAQAAARTFILLTRSNP